MKKLLLCLLLFPILVNAQKSESPYPFTLSQDSAYVRANYTKTEVMVQMRDGVKLFTQIYAPKDLTKKFPIIMSRTPYTCSPYGANKFKKRIGPNPFMLKENYIVVYQDVRGRWASEGKFVEMTPHIDNKKTKTDIDEASDTYDTIDWLVKNIKNNNGKVGQWGISYPGFFTSAGSVSEHPALKASSPQAPMADLRRDDTFHNGAFMIAANFGFYNYFQDQSKPTTTSPPVYFETNNPDGYDYYLNEVKTTKNSEEGFYKGKNSFYREPFDHPDYDEHWKIRNILPHLKGIKHAIMIVGGWYDEQDLFGTFNTYKAIEKQNPNIKNIFVVGPWTHGGWEDSSGQFLADVDFGSKVSPYFQENIEAKFFRHYLIDDSKPLDLPEATLFETGTNKWRSFDTYPAKGTQEKNLYLQPNGKLGFDAPSAENASTEYISDPNKPVPFYAKINDGFSSSYMVGDQRFAYSRPDVISFQTDILEKDMTLSGIIKAFLKVSTTGTDADWVVKVIDVYPKDTENPDPKSEVVLGNYQQLVRSEIIRGKYRNSESKPEPFVPNQVTDVSLELQDVLHTFKKGHRIMVQIQSSCFPWADRNPQKFMNIFQAEESDYQKTTHKVFHQKGAESYLKIGVLE